MTVRSALGRTVMEDTFQLPGRFKRVARTSVAGKETVLTFVVSGGKTWTKKGDAEAEAEPEESRETDRERYAQSELFNFPPFLGEEFRLTKLPGEGEGPPGVAVVGVRAQAEGRVPADLFFDAKFGHLRKVRVPVPGREGVTATYALLDYKKIDGGWVPMQLRRYDGGEKVWEMTILEVEFRDTFDPSVFAKP
jgi:hypothetical protein